MTDRNPIRWLMTDERLGEALWQALHRLPPGSGVIFRHYATPPRARWRLLRQVWRIARARRLVLVVARAPVGWRGGRHGERGALTWPVHDARDGVMAQRAGAQVLLVSPLYPTRSHPGATALGPSRAAMLGRGGGTVIALGGMTERRWRVIRHLGFDGWAGIDAWAE